MTTTKTKAIKEDPQSLAEELRAMRRSAGRHIPTRDGLIRWSIVLDDVMIGYLSDAADVIDRIDSVTAERDALAARLAEIERAEPVAWMHADRRMADGWAPRSARAENFVGWSPLIYIPGVAPQPPAAEPAARRPPLPFVKVSITG